jgi:hypothetical protein
MDNHRLSFNKNITVEKSDNILMINISRAKQQVMSYGGVIPLAYKISLFIGGAKVVNINK